MFSFSPKNCRRLLSWSRGFPLGLAARFMRDRSGAYAVILGLIAPVFIGALALGSETGLWYATQAKMQGAADSAAISAALGLIAGHTNYTLEADATAASNGFVNGASGTTVTVNKPPKSGPNKGTAGAVEVIIKQPQKLLFSSLFLKSPVVVEARAVAGAPAGVVCVLAKGKQLLSLIGSIDMLALAAILADQCNVADNNPSLLALTMALSSITAQQVNVVGGIVNLLGSITTTQGVHSPAPPTPDPFEGLTVGPVPACDPTPMPIVGPGTFTLFPGHYCSGISVTLGASVTLKPGPYYVEAGLLGLSVNVDALSSLTGTGPGGVTIILIPGTLLSLSVNLLGAVNVTAPTSGPFANVALFVPPGPLFSVLVYTATAPNFVGTIYAPGTAVTYALSGATHTGQCTRLIADSIIMTLGGASFSKCAVTLGPSAAAPASLLE